MRQVPAGMVVSQANSAPSSIAVAFGPTRPARTQLQQVLGELRHNRSAVLGLSLLCGVILVAMLAPWLAPYGPYQQSLLDALQPPSANHWMGTDELGRDIFSRILHGTSISLQVGLVAVGIAAAIGVTVGLLAGFLQGWFDTIALRLVDALLAFPDILLAMAVLTTLGPNMTSVTIGVGVSQIPAFVRLTRSTTLVVRELEYVQAARVLGARDARIVFRHILPNVVASIVVLASLSVGSAILVGAGLSFLGLGAQPPTPEWGAMLIGSRVYIQQAPWVAIFPGAAIMVTVWAVNMFGDGLRDALDARLRGVS